MKFLSKITQGIILIRAANEESSNKVRLVKEVLEKAKNKLERNFIVVNEMGIRIRKIYQKNKSYFTKKVEK